MAENPLLKEECEDLIAELNKGERE